MAETVNTSSYPQISGLLRCVRTLTVKSLCAITVVAKYLKTCRKSLLYQPHIKIRNLLFLPMAVAAAANVVNRQKFIDVLATASAAILSVRIILNSRLSSPQMIFPTPMIPFGAGVSSHQFFIGGVMVGVFSFPLFYVSTQLFSTLFITFGGALFCSLRVALAVFGDIGAPFLPVLFIILAKSLWHTFQAVRSAFVGTPAFRESELGKGFVGFAGRAARLGFAVLWEKIESLRILLSHFSLRERLDWLGSFSVQPLFGPLYAYGNIIPREVRTRG